MSCSKNEAYLQNKNHFFSEFSNCSKVDLNPKFEFIDKHATGIGYSFLLENHSSLETEFTNIYNRLKKDDKNKKRFWFYCYYLATLLQAFYQAYSINSKVTHYASIKQKIKDRLNQKQEQRVEEASFIDSMYQSFIAGFSNLAKAPSQLSSLRGYIAYTNICRIYWVFCRLTMIEGLQLARDIKLIEQLDLVLGMHTDVDKIISAFRAPTFITNYLSVGLLLSRFMIDGTLLLKHTFFPSELEKGSVIKPTTAWDRFKYEVYKRQGNFINDIGWAFINLITNFPEILNISGTTAGYITAVYLVADIALIVYMNYCAEQEFLSKYAQYWEEIKTYEKKNNGDLDLHIQMLLEQLKELERDWRVKQATSYFAAAAGALLMMGFTASMFVNPGLMVAASYFVCLLGTAMYLSVGAYAKYKEKAEALNDDKTNVIALKEYESTKNDFIYTLTKNTLMPPTLILSFALYWPAALVLTAAYLSYELYHTHDQHLEQVAINEMVHPKV